MNTLLSFFRGVRALLWALLSFILAVFPKPVPRRLLTRQEKRAIARKRANDVTRSWRHIPRSWRRRDARHLAKMFFRQMQGATV